jgi:hypothetical protein
MAIRARRTASIAASLWPLAGAGTGNLVNSEGETCSAFASATVSDRLSSARSPFSIRDRCEAEIPASPAITRRDLRRDWRICRSRRPIVRESSSTSITCTNLFAECGTSSAGAPEPSPRGWNTSGERSAPSRLAAIAARRRLGRAETELGHRGHPQTTALGAFQRAG